MYDDDDETICAHCGLVNCICEEEGEHDCLECACICGALCPCCDHDLCTCVDEG